MATDQPQRTRRRASLSRASLSRASLGHGAGPSRIIVVVLIALMATIGFFVVRDDGADRGVNAQRLDETNPILGGAHAVIGDRLLSTHADTMTRSVTWYDAASLERIVDIDLGSRLLRVSTDPRLVLTAGTMVEVYTDDGTMMWSNHDPNAPEGSPWAVTPDGTVILGACTGSVCDLTAITTDGALRWTATLDGDPHPVIVGYGELLTNPGNNPQSALPPAVAAIVTSPDGSGRQMVRVDSDTGEITVLHDVVEGPLVTLIVTPDTIALLDAADSEHCVLTLYRHDGEELLQTSGDCREPDGVDASYLYYTNGQLFWMRADDLLLIDAVTGEMANPIALESDSAMPSQAGLRRSTGEGFSLIGYDGTELLEPGWEWIHDTTESAVVLGREVRVGPPWSRRSVHEIAVISTDDGRVCGSQRVPMIPFPHAAALPGCNAVITSLSSANPPGSSSGNGTGGSTDASDASTTNWRIGTAVGDP